MSWARRIFPITAPTASAPARSCKGLADGYFVLPEHDRQLPGHANRVSKVSGRLGRSSSRPSRRWPNAHPAAPRHPRAQDGRSLPPRTRPPASGINAAWPATRPGCARPCGEIPPMREEFWRECERAGRRLEELNQSLEKAGRVADFPRIRGIDVPGRAGPAPNHAAAISARNTRRPTARRSATTRTFRLRGGVGVCRRKPAGYATAQGTAGIRGRPPRHPELQMIASQAPPSAISSSASGARKTPVSPGAFAEYEAREGHSRRAPRSWRCSTS